MRGITTNAGAKDWLGLQTDDLIGDIDLAPEPRDDLEAALRKAVAGAPDFTHTLRIESETKESPTLLQFRHLSEIEESNGPTARAVTSRWYRHEDQKAVLKQLFGLTIAEGEVVGGFVRDLSIKTIAENRGTSESTLRDQLNKIFAKMDLNSQSEIIRLTLPITPIDAPVCLGSMMS